MCIEYSRCVAPCHCICTATATGVECRSQYPQAWSYFDSHGYLVDFALEQQIKPALSLHLPGFRRRSFTIFSLTEMIALDPTSIWWHHCHRKASLTALAPAMSPLKKLFVSLQVSFVHPGQRSMSCVDTLSPFLRWFAAMSARARMKTGEPFRESQRFTPVRPSCIMEQVLRSNVSIRSFRQNSRLGVQTGIGKKLDAPPLPLRGIRDRAQIASRCDPK